MVSIGLRETTFYINRTGTVLTIIASFQIWVTLQPGHERLILVTKINSIRQRYLGCYILLHSYNREDILTSQSGVVLLYVNTVGVIVVN